MAGVQKVFLRIMGLVGDGEDIDEMPDRVGVSGKGRFVPTMASGTGDVTQGPDSLYEIRLIEPIPFDIVNGMVTYGGDPYVWLPVPSGQWMWQIVFDQIRIGQYLRDLRGYSFPIEPATQAQISDPTYPGLNLAQFGIGTWEPGTVNLTADAIGQITIMLGRASNSAIAAETQAGRAETARGEANTAAAAAGTARNAAETASAAAGTRAGAAATSAWDADQSAKASADSARASAASAVASGVEVTRAKGHADEAGRQRQATDQLVTQFDVTRAEALDDVEAARVGALGDVEDLGEGYLADLDALFDQEMAAFTALRGEMSVIADEVAIDANRAEEAAGFAEDALEVVRAHRWVPQGDWEDNLTYQAGDVVVYDGGSYYAQAPVATGVAPPAAPWMILGHSGITDASELTGALTEYVDATDVVVDLGSQIPGVDPELQVVQLAAILGLLYLSLDSTVDAPRVAGALTDQVNASSAQVNYQAPGTNEPIAGTLAQLLRTVHERLNGAAAAEHTHSVDEIEATGTRSASTTLMGDGTWKVPYAVPTQVEAEAGTATTARVFSAQRVRQAADAAITAREWFGTQAQFDALSTKNPLVTYYVFDA